MQFQRKEVGVDYTVEAFEEHEETRAEITGSKGEETNVDDDYFIYLFSLSDLRFE